jgi:uncharacterized protein YndB with AHSA1/START domain
VPLKEVIIMTTLSQSILLKASPEEIFTFINDTDKMNETCKGWLESKYTSEGPTGVGTTMHCRGTAGGQRAEWDIEIVEFETNKRLTSRSTAESKFKIADLFLLEPTTEGTKATYSMDYELPYSVLGKLLDKIKVRKEMEINMTKMLENIRKALET